MREITLPLYRSINYHVVTIAECVYRRFFLQWRGKTNLACNRTTQIKKPRNYLTERNACIYSESIVLKKGHNERLSINWHSLWKMHDLYNLLWFCGSEKIPYPGLNSSSAVSEDEFNLFRHISTVQHPPNKPGLEPQSVKGCTWKQRSQMPA